MFRILLFLAVALFAHQTLAQTQPVSLPNLNYWNLSKELLVSPKLADQLEVSPGQLSAIGEMRARKEWDVLLGEKLRPTDTRQPLAVGSDQAWSALDDVVKKELLEILTEEQLHRLKSIKLRSMYPAGYSPFEHALVLNICDVSTADLRKLEASLETVKSSHMRQAAKLRYDAAVRVLELLPEEPRNLFVIYAGNKYFPNLPIPEGISYDLVPFPSEFKSFMVAAKQLSRDAIREQLTTDQAQAVDAILSEFRPSFERFESQSRYRTFPEYVKASMRLGMEELRDTVPESILFEISRAKAASEFDAVFSAPFMRGQLCEFFGLSDRQVMQIQLKANEEQQTLSKELGKLNEKTFKTLNAVLSEASRLRFEALFKDVWTTQFPGGVR